MLQNIYTIGRGAVNKWKIKYFKIKIIPFIINRFPEMIPFEIKILNDKK